MLRKTSVLESLFNSAYCEIFKKTYFDEHLRSATRENVFMKLRKIKKFWEEIFILHFFNIIIRDKWKCMSLCFYIMIVSFEVYIYIQYHISLMQWERVVKDVRLHWTSWQWNCCCKYKLNGNTEIPGGKLFGG